MILRMGAGQLDLHVVKSVDSLVINIIMAVLVSWL